MSEEIKLDSLRAGDEVYLRARVLGVEGGLAQVKALGAKRAVTIDLGEAQAWTSANDQPACYLAKPKFLVGDRVVFTEAFYNPVAGTVIGVSSDGDEVRLWIKANDGHDVTLSSSAVRRTITPEEEEAELKEASEFKATMEGLFGALEGSPDEEVSSGPVDFFPDLAEVDEEVAR